MRLPFCSTDWRRPFVAAPLNCDEAWKSPAEEPDMKVADPEHDVGEKDLASYNGAMHVTLPRMLTTPAIVSIATIAAVSTLAASRTQAWLLTAAIIALAWYATGIGQWTASRLFSRQSAWRAGLRIPGLVAIVALVRSDALRGICLGASTAGTVLGLGMLMIVGEVMRRASPISHEDQEG